MFSYLYKVSSKLKGDERYSVFKFIKKSFEKLDNVYFYNIGVGEIKLSLNWLEENFEVFDG